MLRTTVLLADDHLVVRQGLRALLQSERDIEIVGEAETGREAVRLAKALKPDVVVMDIAMPQLNGLEAARQIIKEVSRSRVLILSSYSDDEYVDQLTEAGAAGYLLKQGAFSDVVRGIREAKKGNTFFNPAISKRVMHRYRETVRAASARKRGDLLTPRETEVLQLVAEGEGNKQMAAELGISVKMVEKHRQRLMNKLGIHHVAGLTRYAICKGIIETSKIARKLQPAKQNQRLRFGGVQSIHSGRNSSTTSSSFAD
jgi:DNA-binding NarL/FixJ family response regulator